MKKFIQSATLALLLLTVGFTSCRKNESSESDLTSMQDQNSADFNVDLVVKEVDMAATDGGLKKGGFPIVAIDSIASPRTMTIDYGTTNYVCEDGNLRRGIILVTLTGAYRQPGTVITINFKDFYQNNNHVEGIKTISNTGLNSSNQMTYMVVVEMKVTNTSNEVYNCTSNRTRTWISGYDTKTKWDDIYLISGTSSGTNRRGDLFTARTISDLKIDMSCQWRIVSGTIEMNPEGKSTRTIDYGNGNCDNEISVTVNGKTRTMSRRK
jgi:hypothetical protein